MLRPHFLGQAILSMTLILSLAAGALAQDTRPAALRVGLLVDAACTDGKSREAAWRILSGAEGFAARRVTSEELRASALGELDVVVFPGGTGSGQGRALGVEGAAMVSDFVAGGRGCVAICAGGYLVAEGYSAETSAIELVNAQLWDSENWARGEQFIAVKTVGGDDASSSRTMWFENGPIFVPAGRDDLPAYTPLVRYVTDMAKEGAPTGMMTGRDAVIAAPFGSGRVVVFGPHPELSPTLNDWLVNAVRWAAGNGDGAVSLATVLGEPLAKPGSE